MSHTQGQNMRWLKIQDHLFPLDKILYVSWADESGHYLIYIKLTNDEHIHFIYDTDDERDRAFKALWMDL